jgi:hypothetical protein
LLRPEIAISNRSIPGRVAVTRPVQWHSARDAGRNQADPRQAPRINAQCLTGRRLTAPALPAAAASNRSPPLHIHGECVKRGEVMLKHVG